MVEKWIIREHRGSLNDSMKTCKYFTEFHDMIEYALHKCVFPTTKEDINISYYSRGDERINWYPVYIVSTCREVIGFCTFKEC